MASASSTTALLASLWDRYRPLMLARLELLDRAAAADPLPPTLRRDAIIVAHNLSGSLGMFGYPEGTRLARQLEEFFEAENGDGRRVQPLCQALRVVICGSETSTN